MTGADGERSHALSRRSADSIHEALCAFPGRPQRKFAPKGMRGLAYWLQRVSWRLSRGFPAFRSCEPIALFVTSISEPCSMRSGASVRRF